MKMYNDFFREQINAWKETCQVLEAKNLELKWVLVFSWFTYGLTWLWFILR
jgi:hypothetical protein